MKFSNLCGIFATLFVTTTMVLLASCSQDDDNYDSDMYTLAEMGTRLGGKGDPGEGGNEWDSHLNDNECGIWCLIHLKGGNNAESMIRGVIERNNIDISNGISQPVMVMIGDSIGLDFQDFINNKYYEINQTTHDTTLVDDPNRSINKLVELGGETGYLHKVIILLENHYVVGTRVRNKKRRIDVVDMGENSEVAFNRVKGVIW